MSFLERNRAPKSAKRVSRRSFSGAVDDGELGKANRELFLITWHVSVVAIQSYDSLPHSGADDA